MRYDEGGKYMKKEKMKFSDYVYYYKWHVIILLFAVFALVFLLKDCGSNTKDDAVVSAILSNGYGIESAEQISGALTEAGVIPDLNGDGEKKVWVNMTLLPYETGSEEAQVAYQKASISLMTDESVIFLLDEDILEIYEERGYFTDIGKLAERFGVTDVYTAEDGKILGISLKGNEFLESKGIVTDTLFACYREFGDSIDEKTAKKIEIADGILEFIIR